MKKFGLWGRNETVDSQACSTRTDKPVPGSGDYEKISSRLKNLVIELERLLPGRAEQLLTQLCTGLQRDASDDQCFHAAEIAAGIIYPKYKFSEFGRLYLEDQDFLDYYCRFMDPDNWHSLDRKYTLEQLLKLSLNLPGDMVECGVYKGASAYLMCHALQATTRRVHLFDSFEGLSMPGELDGDYWVPGALEAPEKTLKQTLAGFDNYRIYRGWIPERFEEVAGISFSFVHIDVDLHQPTYDSLEFFYPRTLGGGIILMDDYGFSSCPGAKRAADDFFDAKPEPILMLTTGQGLVIKQ